MTSEVNQAGFEPPNHTQTPNAFFDNLLKDIDSICELKVTLALIRRTFGWHKQEDQVSLSQLVEITNLSRQGVIDGIALGMKRGTILRRSKGQAFIYSLKLVNAVDQFNNNTSQRSRPELVNAVDQKTPKLVNAVDTQKKELNKDKESVVQKPATRKTPVKENEEIQISQDARDAYQYYQDLFHHAADTLDWFERRIQAFGRKRIMVGITLCEEKGGRKGRGIMSFVERQTGEELEGFDDNGRRIVNLPAKRPNMTVMRPTPKPYVKQEVPFDREEYSRRMQVPEWATRPAW